MDRIKQPLFVPFHNQKIFPQASRVIALVDRIELGNNGIPDAIIHKFSLIYGVQLHKLS